MEGCRRDNRKIWHVVENRRKGFKVIEEIVWQDGMRVKEWSSKFRVSDRAVDGKGWRRLSIALQERCECLV